MRQRIGIAVATDRVRAVGVRGRRILWSSEVEVLEVGGIAAAVDSMIAAAPMAHRFRPTARVALGPSFSQIKPLTGLPPLGSTTLLARLVAEGAPRFFLAEGRSLLTGIRVLDTGEVWAAGVDLALVRDIEAVCRSHRLRLEGVVPVAVALAWATEAREYAWQDGQLRIVVRGSTDCLEEVRRYRVDHGTALPPPPRVTQALGSLGNDAWRYADAYGAAVLPVAECVAVRPGRRGGVPVLRMIAAACTVLLSVLAVWMAPAIAASHAGGAAAARIAGIDQERRVALQAEGELERFTTALLEIAAFDSQRRSALLLLGEIARALPDSTAIVSLRVERAEATMVAITPRAGAMFAPLQRVPGITFLEIVGPVTREVVRGREFERATLRFGAHQRTGVPVNPVPGGRET